MKLKSLWYGWKKISFKIAVYQSKILLTVLYFILLTPVVTISKLAGSDPLKLKDTGASSWWEDREKEELLVETLKKQF